jgi:hypothetical protein
MAAILVTYDIPTDKDNGKLLDWIKEHEHIRLGQSCYVIKTKTLFTDVLFKLPADLPSEAKILVLDTGAHTPNAFTTTPNLSEEAKWIREVNAEAAERMGTPGSYG